MIEGYKIDKDYEQYLCTPEWDKKRRQRLHIDNGYCQMCNCSGTSYNPLTVHHITYKSKGNEDIYRDLVTLCWQCHNAVHRMMNRITDEKGTRGWKDRLPSANHIYLMNKAITEDMTFERYKNNDYKFINEGKFIEAQRRILYGKL